MGAQVSSQRKIKKVKQALGKREQTTLPQRSIVTTGKLIFKAKQAHLPNDLTFGRRDNHGLSNFTCLVFAKWQ